jgi:glycosyltransferase involved in cell wall biosynthesis
VLHLHQYRLVCAVGVCFTQGEECTRCHGSNTLPGILRNCRGSMPEALAYGASLSLWQRRLAQLADAVIVPSAFARERLRELGAPLAWERVHVLPPPLRVPDGTSAAPEAELPAHPFALVASRLAPEKGVDVAIDACRMAGVPLVIAGDGPEHAALRERVRGADVRFLGRVGDRELAAVRSRAAIALAPSRSAETFGIAAAEAMAAGVPVVASRIGALPELVEEEGLVTPGSARALAAGIERRLEDPDAGERGRGAVRAHCSPEAVAASLRTIYERSGRGGST